jgi:hypothetical protein
MLEKFTPTQFKRKLCPCLNHVVWVGGKLISGSRTSLWQFNMKDTYWTTKELGQQQKWELSSIGVDY